MLWIASLFFPVFPSPFFISLHMCLILFFRFFVYTYFSLLFPSVFCGFSSVCFSVCLLFVFSQPFLTYFFCFSVCLLFAFSLSFLLYFVCFSVCLLFVFSLPFLTYFVCFFVCLLFVYCLSFYISPVFSSVFCLCSLCLSFLFLCLLLIRWKLRSKGSRPAEHYGPTLLYP